ncbi:hypothetical protein B0T25DRAFT_581417 [Lasiosphaeria hispida]|uniref:HNH nuclease domain-containing protein n=1 Tax=Lasiosphaeria hispida TaxID=260671 RepID=A0AAJ0HJS6_9PEZI|nr:hypothetical protein B0T25DRAFT_581417 [Lasiosphaeria hispida]
MVAAISEIRIFLQTLRDSLLPGSLASGILGFAPDGIRAYLPKARSPEAAAEPLRVVPTVILNELGTPVLSGLVTRSVFSDRVTGRDGHICVFSRMSDPLAAHIFPFTTSKKKNFRRLNEMLTNFWGSEKSMAWRWMFENVGITQSAKNGISMSHQVHFWFDNARFALQPLRETPEGVVVQWHWLKRSVLKPLVYIFPTKDLLEMQWNLLRVAAICGAADVTDDYYDYEHPDERGYDEAVAAKQRAITARQVITAGQAVTIAGQGSVLAKEETKEETPAKGKEEAKEEITAKEAGKEKDGGRAADDTSCSNRCSDVDDDVGGSKARRG